MTPEHESRIDPSIEEEAQKFDQEQRRLRQEAGLETGSDDLVDLKQELGLPEGRGNDPLREVETSSIFDKNIETATKEARQEFVDKFIADSIAQLETEWGSYINSSVNAEKGRELISHQTEAFIIKNAQRFIETGGEPDFGWEADLDLAYYDTDQGRQQFITGFDIKNYSSSEGVDRNDANKQDFATDEQNQQLNEAQERGGLNEKTI